MPNTSPAPAAADITPDGQAPRPAFQQAWADLHAQAVTVLTAACRLRRPHLDGTTAAGEPIDFADFLASVLAGIAANVGSIDRVTAGRPGSWEADLLRQLLTGTVGEDEVWLYEHRTEPVVVPLNVPTLAWDLPGFPDYETALDAALQPFYLVTDPDQPPQVDLTDEQWDVLEAATQATEATVLDAYTRLYTQYADAFTAAVHDAAAQIPVLAAAGITVTVDAVTDPTATDGAAEVVNPVDELAYGPADDQLVARLWNGAATVVPIPTPPVIPAIPGGPS